jgi:hypothetical protein
MPIRIQSHLGREGFAEHFLARHVLPGGAEQPADVFWTANDTDAESADRLARVRDAGVLLLAHPDPLVPKILQISRCWDGLAVVSERPGGISLTEVARPVGERAVLAIVGEVAALLDRYFTRVDPASGQPIGVLHRNVSTDNILIRPDGGLRMTGFDGMTARWTARSAETGVMSLHPGSRLAPEQLAGQAFHQTDVYLLGLVAVDLLSDAVRASRFAKTLALCICDSEGFQQIRDGYLADLHGVSEPGLALLREMLSELPQDRPSGRTVAQRVAAMGIGTADLVMFAASLPTVEPPPGQAHAFVGREIFEVAQDGVQAPAAAPAAESAFAPAAGPAIAPAAAPVFVPAAAPVAGPSLAPPPPPPPTDPLPPKASTVEKMYFDEAPVGTGSAAVPAIASFAPPQASPPKDATPPMVSSPTLIFVLGSPEDPNRLALDTDFEDEATTEEASVHEASSEPALPDVAAPDAVPSNMAETVPPAGPAGHATASSPASIILIVAAILFGAFGVLALAAIVVFLYLRFLA